MSLKAGDPCNKCSTGKFRDGPFVADTGPFIYCDCGHSEKVKEAPPKRFDWLEESTKADETSATALAGSNDLAIRYPMMPKHCNMYGTIFGGIILSMIDQSAFVEARKHGMHRWVTASIEKVDFLKPVRVGDTLSLYTRTIKAGTKSVTVGVDVEVDRYDTNHRERVCSASVTMVSVDPHGKPIPFKSPSTIQYKSA